MKDEWIMKKSSERKMELLKIRKRHRKYRRKKIKLYFKGFGYACLCGICLYLLLIELYIIS